MTKECDWYFIKILCLNSTGYLSRDHKDRFGGVIAMQFRDAALFYRLGDAIGAKNSLPESWQKECSIHKIDINKGKITAVKL